VAKSKRDFLAVVVFGVVDSVGSQIASPGISVVSILSPDESIKMVFDGNEYISLKLGGSENEEEGQFLH
jgi:hypothetical protein